MQTADSPSVDLVICRLTLQYTDNSRTLAEVARVLRLEGRVLLKFHHARYYTARRGNLVQGTLGDSVPAASTLPVVRERAL